MTKSLLSVLTIFAISTTAAWAGPGCCGSSAGKAEVQQAKAEVQQAKAEVQQAEAQTRTMKAGKAIAKGSACSATKVKMAKAEKQQGASACSAGHAKMAKAEKKMKADGQGCSKKDCATKVAQTDEEKDEQAAG